MDALNNGKGTQKKTMDDICHDLVTCIIKTALKSSNTGGRDNNASDSGIDEDEEYHDSLENIETVIESEGSFLEVPNDTIDLIEIIAAPASNLISPGDGEYWDPVSDTYRSKRTNDRVPDAIVQEENTPGEHETDSSVESSSALG